MQYEWFILRKLVEDINTRLDALIGRLREMGYSKWVLSSISELREELSHSKTPLGLSRRIWDKYVLVVALIEETSRIASRSGYEFVVYNILPSIREHIKEFKVLLEKAYLLERIQLSLPIILGSLFVFIKVVQEGLSGNMYLFTIATTALITPLIGQIYGLIATVILGLGLIVLGGDIGSGFTGLLLIAVSALYFYILYFTKSQKFTFKLQQAMEGVNKTIQSILEPTGVNLEEAIREVVASGAFNVESSGLFKYIDPSELLKYKASLLIAHRVAGSTQIPRSNYIKPEEKIESREFRGSSGG
jgi:hypothetical protein